MKLILKLLVPAILMVLLTSCGGPDNGPGDDGDIVFGLFAGECIGDNCVRIFKLTEEELFEDQNDIYPGTIFTGEQFDFEGLPNSKFELAEDFASFFPEEILDETESRFGCPDCGDQGGIFLGWYENDTFRSSTIDVRKDEIPEYMHDFVDELFVVMELLRE